MSQPLFSTRKGPGGSWRVLEGPARLPTLNELKWSSACLSVDTLFFLFVSSFWFPSCFSFFSLFISLHSFSYASTPFIAQTQPQSSVSFVFLSFSLPHVSSPDSSTFYCTDASLSTQKAFNLFFLAFLQSFLSAGWRRRRGKEGELF